MVTKKQQKNISVVILIALAVIFFSRYGDNNNTLSITSTDFTPVFCNDYEFTCCNEKVDSVVSSSRITDEIPLLCPLFATRCEIGSVGGLASNTNTFIGSEACHLEEELLRDYWECSDERESSRRTLFPGEYIWVRNTALGGKGINVDANVNTFKKFVDELDFCGSSGCSVGVPVSGADQCTFSPDRNTIYESTSSLLGKVTTTSYTVPSGSCVLAYQSGNRHICGYLEESCSTNNDCTGHTYGNVECIGKTKQTYGCRNFGSQIIEGDKGPFDDGWTDGQDVSPNDQNTFGKRCEIIKAEQVQCCGDSDCGGDLFCDVSTFTCKEKVQCSFNSDCGVSVQCDYSTKTLKTPKCSNGKCEFTELDVDCCNDQQCASGEFCNVNKECEERSITKKQCPFECCVDEELYFDKSCPNNLFCNNGECSTEPPPAKKCESCEDFVKSQLFGAFFPNQKCDGIVTTTPPFILSNTTCVFSFLKLALIPIVFIFSTIFSNSLFRTSKQFKIKNKGASLLLSIMIGGILTTLLYFTFTIGIIAVGIWLVFLIILKVIK